MRAKLHHQASEIRTSPERTCIVTQAIHSQDDLIRFALSPANEVVPDIAARLPGRGAWVLNSRDILTSAIARKAFDRAWRRKVDVPENLIKIVDKLLERRALDALSLANKAGCVICGYENVKKRIKNANCVLLLQAADASAEGRKKLARKYRGSCDALKIEPQIIDIFTVQQISLAIGRPNVVHAAIDCAEVTGRFAKAATRASQFRSHVATC